MRHMTSIIDRRTFLAALPALTMVPRVLAQSGAPPMRVRGLSQLTLTVSDVKRSLAFYQGLFGMPVQARQGSTVFLRIGSGPQFLALKPAAAGERPSISAFGMGVEDFKIDRVVKTLADHGVTPGDAAASDSGIPAPMKVVTKVRKADAGGAANGTREIFVGDPSGIVFQLHDIAYCGGAGELGNVCRAVEPSPAKGLLTTRDMSHFTINVADEPRTVAFYQELFGFTVRARQGAAPAWGVGPGVHFLMFIGGGGRGGAPGAAPAAVAGARIGGDAAGGAIGAGRGGAAAAPRGPRIDHACMSIDNFNPETVTKTLSDYGIKPQQGQARDPLVTYISLRMPNRGGAEGGTPELYFTDPDGLAIQLQDMKYCGGGGFLGDVCPPL
jgi:catechol 2,3-dioxygenase-like lactoylglutathione lyase family enzyme